jgi:mRNA interferase HigB
MNGRMRIISRRKLKDFWEVPEYRDAEQPLKAWFAEAKDADWKNSAEVKQRFRSASILHDNRVVFNVGGNKYRIVVKMHYNTGIAYIRFVGTHKQYDKIDAENI